MQVRWTYSGNNKLAAWLLLALFVAFSIHTSLFQKEVYENMHAAEHVLIAECIEANSIYQHPVVKYDTGQHRFVVLFLKFAYYASTILNNEPEIKRKQSAGFFPLPIIPTYLFDCVLRIWFCPVFYKAYDVIP